MFTQLKKAVVKFNDDEAGLQALEVVMIVAIAAVVLIAVKTKWPVIKDFFNKNVDEIVKFE